MSSVSQTFNSIVDLPSEYHCHRNFYKIIWGDLTCSKCGTKGIKFRSNYEYCPHCKHKSSVKAKTIFKGSNLSFRQIYLLIWCWQRRYGIKESCEIVGISYPTIERWYERFRASLPEPDEVLEDIVEIDGSFFGKKKYKKQKLVAGAINPGSHQLVLKVVYSRDSEAVEDFVKAYIKKGSLIRTDGLKSYNNESLEGYDHESCNHEEGIFGITNHIENAWSVIKRSLRHIYRDLTFDLNKLNLILREWENRYNYPELFYNVDSYLKLRGCSKLVR